LAISSESILIKSLGDEASVGSANNFLFTMISGLGVAWNGFLIELNFPGLAGCELIVFCEISVVMVLLSMVSGILPNLI
jgi:hypothetical protein